jgi:hypothetical protein
VLSRGHTDESVAFRCGYLTLFPISPTYSL